jgi:hypothetical protein
MPSNFPPIALDLSVGTFSFFFFFFLKKKKKVSSEPLVLALLVELNIKATEKVGWGTWQ